MLFLSLLLTSWKTTDSKIACLIGTVLRRTHMSLHIVWFMVLGLSFLYVDRLSAKLVYNKCCDHTEESIQPHIPVFPVSAETQSCKLYESFSGWVSCCLLLISYVLLKVVGLLWKRGVFLCPFMSINNLFFSDQRMGSETCKQVGGFPHRTGVVVITTPSFPSFSDSHTTPPTLPSP